MNRLPPLVLALCLVPGCTASQGPVDTDARPTTSPTPIQETSAAPTGYVRACDESVYGELGRDFKDDSVVLGPILFLGASHLADEPARAFRTRSGGPKSVKVLLLVREGPLTVTLSIAQADRRSAALLYNPRRFNTERLRDAERSITFVSCDEGSHPHNLTQFNGAFLVDGPRCVGIELQIHGRSQPIERTMSFGAGRCG